MTGSQLSLPFDSRPEVEWAFNAPGHHGEWVALVRLRGVAPVLLRVGKNLVSHLLNGAPLAWEWSAVTWSKDSAGLQREVVVGCGVAGDDVEGRRLAERVATTRTGGACAEP